MLIAVDEVERLQDGIEAGWASVETLDFFRAMGNALRHVRLMLVGAVPLDRLGAVWVDRLISARHRSIGYLDEVDARDLIVRPTADFPEDVYPAECVDRIVEETGCQPFLVQLVCFKLIQRLNQRKLMRATMEELEQALDHAVEDAGHVLFAYLWNRKPEEQVWLLRLAREEADPPPADAALRALEKAQLVHRQDGRPVITVPMFSAWLQLEKCG